MRDAAASFIGFTDTPIAIEGKGTRGVFGNTSAPATFRTPSMKVQIYYESRRATDMCAGFCAYYFGSRTFPNESNVEFESGKDWFRGQRS
jgi:hypothetical protein